MVGIRSFIILVIFALSFSAQARTSPWTRFVKRMGCGIFLAAPTIDPSVQQIIDDLGSHIKVSAAPDGSDLFHVKARFYSTKVFSEMNAMTADSTHELNFYISSDEIIIQSLDNVLSNDGFWVVSRLPEHFPFARMSKIECRFDIRYLAQFIDELKKLGYAFY